MQCCKPISVQPPAPFRNASPSAHHVKVVSAFSRYFGLHRKSTNAIPLIAAGCVELTKDAVIAGIFAGRACVVKGVLADTAKIIFGKIPSPCRDRVPPLDLDLHRWQISGESNNPVAYRVVLFVGSLCWSVYGVSHPMLRAGEVLAPPLSVLPATAAKC